MKNASLLWKTIEMMMRVIDDEQDCERREMLVNLSHEMSDIHKAYMNDMKHVAE